MSQNCIEINTLLLVKICKVLFSVFIHPFLFIHIHMLYCALACSLFHSYIEEIPLLTSATAETLLQKVIQRKLCLFGHICRMNDSRKIKTLVFGMMDGSNKRGREWSDDIEQWCGTTLQQLSHAALDRQRWAAIVRMASDTNGH